MNALKLLLVASLLTVCALSAAADEEQDLIAILKSNAGPVEKSEACKKLRLSGTAKSVPALAPLLGDERVSQAARYALEGIPGREASAAVREAMSSSSGVIRLGLIDSVGWRRDAAAVPLLAPLLSDQDAATGSAAAAALGRIGGGDAVSALRSARGKVQRAAEPAVIEALLRCADQLLAAKDAAAAEAVYESLFAPAEEESIRIAAYAGLIRSAKDGGIARMKSAIQGKDPAGLSGALFALRGESGNEKRAQGGATKPEVARTIAEVLPEAAPGLQIALLAVLQQSGETTVLPAVMAAARGPEAAVKAAAMTALGELGDASTVPLLAEAAASLDATVQAAARKALVSLRRGEIAGALIAQLSEATPAIQLELVRALSARSEKSAVPELLGVARSGRPAARKAVLAALGGLSTGGDVPALVQLLGDMKEADGREGVRVVFEKLAEREGEKPKWNTEPIARELASGNVDHRKALLPIAAMFVDERLRAAMRASVKDSDAGVRTAAARAMCDARDTALLPDLIQLARETPEAGQRSLALEGVVRLTTSGNMATQKKAEALAEAMSLASRAEDKRMVLSGVGQTPHPLTLGLAEKAAADPAAQAEAEMACLQIAQKLAATDYAAAEASLTRLVNGAGNAVVKTNAQAVLRKLNSGWVCAGPYRQAGKQAQDLFNIAFPPETPGASGVAWQRAPGLADPARPGEVDLGPIVGGNHGVMYLKTRVYVPAAQAVRFWVGSDDGIKLWVNGELVHANNAVRGLTPGEDKAKGRLREGWNEMLAKITQHTLGCGMTLKITTEDGKAVQGLKMEPQK